MRNANIKPIKHGVYVIWSKELKEYVCINNKAAYVKKGYAVNGLHNKKLNLEDYEIHFLEFLPF